MPSFVSAVLGAAVFLGPMAARGLESGIDIHSHLYALETEIVRFDRGSRNKGGAIESMGDGVLLRVSQKGRIALVHPGGDAERLDVGVPMNLDALKREVSFDGDDRRSIDHFRVLDVLVKNVSSKRFDLYVTHHYFTGECNRFRLSSASLHPPPPPPHTETAVSLSSWRTIFDAEPCLAPRWFQGHQAGGKMLEDGPDRLSIAIGDHKQDGWKFPDRIDDPGSHLGKLVRIEIGTGKAEILARGLRNPQGFARDGDGNLWASEHGPQGGDELNLLKPGNDYGWPNVSYGVDYGRILPSRIEYEAMGRHDGFEPPVFSWVPSIAPTAVVANDERLFPLWGDDLLISSLKAKSIFRVRRLGERIQYVERIEIGTRIRDMAWMSDGRLALMSNFEIFFLRPSDEYCDEESRERRDVYAAPCGPDAAGRDAPAVSRGERLYGRYCVSCHGPDLARHGAGGPSLAGAVGRRAGSVEGYDFSSALASLNHVWTRESLARFLADPESFAPGTSMSEVSVTEARARAIADFLADW